MGLLDLLMPGSGLANWADNHQNTLGAIGAGLAQGPTFSAGLANAAAGMPKARALDQQFVAKNQTVQMLAKQAPEIADAVKAGGLTPAQGLQLYFQQKQAANKAQVLSPGDMIWQNGKLRYAAPAAAPKPTSAMQGYEYAKGQGYPGTFLDYQEELKRAGAPSVNVGPEENAFSKAVGGARGGNYKSVLDAATAARNANMSLGQLGEALSGAGYQGVGGNQAVALRKIGASFGLDTDGVADAQLAQSLSRQLALQLRNPQSGAGMPGQLSNSDRQYLESMTPGLGNTPEGNKEIIQAAVALNNRKIEIASLADQYIAKNGTLDSGFDQVVTAYNDAHPIFGGKTSAGMAPGAGGVVDYRQYFGGQ